MLCTVNPKFNSGYCVHFTSNIGTNLKNNRILKCISIERVFHNFGQR